MSGTDLACPQSCAPGNVSPREAELTARLDHFNIVAGQDAGVDGDRMWIAMQYVAGSDAAVLIRNTDLAVDIVEQAAAGLDYAHGQGMLHRDVKSDTTGRVGHTTRCPVGDLCGERSPVTRTDSTWSPGSPTPRRQTRGWSIRNCRARAPGPECPDAAMSSPRPKPSTPAPVSPRRSNCPHSPATPSPTERATTPSPQQRTFTITATLRRQ